MGKETRRDFSNGIRDLVYNMRQKGRCNYCLKQLRQNEGHFDHIRPERFFTKSIGLNDKNNCQFLCHLCHKQKSYLEQDYQKTDPDIREDFNLGPDPLARLSENVDRLFTDPQGYFNNILLDLDWTKETQPKKMDVTQDGLGSKENSSSEDSKTNSGEASPESFETKKKSAAGNMKINIFIVGSFISLIGYALINSQLDNSLLSIIIVIVFLLILILGFWYIKKKMNY